MSKATDTLKYDPKLEQFIARRKRKQLVRFCQRWCPVVICISLLFTLVYLMITRF